MKNYIFIIVLIIIFMVVLFLEIRDRFLLKDYPVCKFVTNYCNGSDDIYIVERKPKDDEEKIGVLLDKLVEKFNMNEIVYWRFSLIMSFIIIFIFYFFNRLDSQNIAIQSYFFLLFLCWFVIYWSFNHYNFHYLNKYGESAKNISAIIKDKIKSK